MRNLIFLLSISYSFWGFAQNVVEKPLLSESATIFEHEAKFRSWLKQQPQNTKGWKWQARYEYELLKRADANGMMPTTETWLNSFNKIQALQQSFYSKARTTEPSWAPAGPYGDKSLAGIGRVNCMAFHPKDSLTFYLGFGQGGIWKTTNGGKSYSPLGDNLPIMRISSIAIDPNNPETLYISLCDFAYIGYDLYTADKKRNTPYGLGVYKSIDGGKTWNATGLKNQITDLVNSLTSTIWVNPKNSNEVLVAGVKGIFKSTDGGNTWTQKLDKLTSQLLQDPSNPNVLYAAAMFVATINVGEAGIWKSEDAGNTWRLLITGIAAKNVQRIEIAIAPTNTNQIYAISCGLDSGYEGFYSSGDGGLSWTKSNNKSNILSYDFTLSGGQGFYDLCILVHPNDQNKVYVGGLIISETADGGKTWIPSTGYSTIHPDQHFLTYNSLNNTIYLCNDGGVYSAKNIVANTRTNVSWTFLCEGINATSCYRLGLSTDGKKIITGAQDNQSYYTNNGQNWYGELGGDGMECALSNNYIYASYQYGNIYFATENTNFNGIFPPNNNNDTGEWTTPYVINNQANEVIIAGGNVYKIPIGKTIENLKVISQFNIPNASTPIVSTALAVPKSDSKIIYVAKKASPLSNTNAQILKTTDNGANWTDITNNIYKNSYITYLSVDDNAPNRVWATLSNFVDGQKVYYSNDAGKTWQNISYNLPNLPANCLANQTDTNSEVLYVGMDIGIYYLLKGTTEWKPLMSNLPNVIIQELEINPSTKKIYAATFGRGIWSADLLSPSTITSTEIYGIPVTLYPNANSGSFILKSDYNEIESIEIIDMLGRKIYQESLANGDLLAGKKITLSNAQAGIYFVKLVKGTQSKIIRMAIE